MTTAEIADCFTEEEAKRFGEMLCQAVILVMDTAQCGSIDAVAFVIHFLENFRDGRISEN